MAKIKSRKHFRTTPLVALAATLPLAAHAAPKEESVAKLPTIEVNAENTYKVDAVSSPKYTQPLLDTPQTVQVIKKELLQEQGAASLVEALRNTPGITLQMGENGNTSAGDTFQMRGFSTQTSTYVDGIRDLGAVSRDVFNLEQIEVVKGPSGSEAGRGAASGYINLVTKLPKAESSREVSARYNTAENARLTADINQAINESTAIRLNVMGQDGGVEGRDVVENNGWAIAPSIAFGLNTDTRFYLYSQHVRQNNIPDGGIPTIGMNGFYYGYASNYANAKNTALQNQIREAINNSADAQKINSALRTAPEVDRSNFYGNANDYEDINSDMVTAKIESDFAENIKFTNISRFGKNRMQRALTGINAIGNAPSVNVTVNPNNTYSYKFNYGTFDPNNKDTWTISRSYQGVDQENKILANTSTLNFNFKTGAVEHDLVAGLEFLKEEQISKTLSTQTPGTKAPSTPAANLYNPNHHDALPALVYTGGYTDGETKTAAAYLFDTVKLLNDRLQFNGGVRVDYYETDYNALAVATDSNTLAVTKTPTNLQAHDTLVSWKLGSLFKPTENSSIYASYAKSLTPPGSANFGLSDTGINSSAAKPQETNHYEVGGKWDVLKNKLALNAAVYHTENENQFTTDPITKESVQEGKTRVEGVELGVVGQITDAWNISAGVAHMKTKQKNQQSFSSTGEKTVTDSVRWSPDWTATLWTTYDIAGFKVGLGARYVDEQKRVNTDSTAPANMPKVPSYVVFDAMAGYSFNKNASLNLNVYNLADKDYISALNNGGSRFVLGQPRSAALTFNYKF
ncbi:catecholate siderophore receptor Fiu [Acinetobacter sp. C26M]|uniref:catecholate siderophore receptor Fiu n=1 Tax=unclassified Acinetobacter TaxID=196816 RepID=UPI00203730B3|nr:MULTISPECIES: catecholate siderophore receptor Fiu [unclassified Acinetobacter]USA47009.1 catecholate siderophore receptor Fiu [Acinetobacter sp. C26M]USA50490.1 catecholate siderophore receptor Fiu [Acinetobacter sp. C26G]